MADILHRIGVQGSTTKQVYDAITTRLFDLPDETLVHTGHGPDTTIGAERANLDA